MAILSSKSRRESSGNTFNKLSETIFGGRSGKVNKRSELHSSDYIFIYESENVSYEDKEVGIDKNYCRIHDTDWNDEHKNTNHREDRFDRRFFDDDCD
jgi:hypothetical protein